MDTIRFPFYARMALTLIALALTCAILSLGANIFIPLVFGLLIAILLLPINNFFENKLHLGRTPYLPYFVSSCFYPSW
jgi:predicted PurR-regulated permease PerM